MSKIKLVFFTDDDEEDLSIFQEITEQLGHDAHLFTSGEQMFTELESIRENPVIIFLDVTMPKVDGFDVLEKIRGLDEYNEIPIVIHSSRCDDDCLDRAFALGANYYMRKSFTYSGVRSTILKAIETDWKSFKPQRDAFLHSH